MSPFKSSAAEISRLLTATITRPARHAGPLTWSSWRRPASASKACHVATTSSGGPEEAVRNLHHDQSFADRILALTPDEAQMDVMLRNRFTVAKLGWQPRWFNPDLEKWLHRIKLPALVVWGDDDMIMPPANAALWRERLPDARLVMVEGCGHLRHVEQASLVARHVCEFLKEVAS